MASKAVLGGGLVGGLTVLAGLWIGMQVPLESVTRLGAAAIVGTVALPAIARPLIARRRPPMDVEAVEPDVVLAAANGLGSVDRNPPSVKLRVVLLPDQISFTGSSNHRVASSLPTIPAQDVTSITWVSSRTIGQQRAQVSLSSRSQDPITLQLNGSGRELERLRRALTRQLRPGVMVSELPPRNRFRASYVPATLALLLVLSSGASATVQRLRPLDAPAGAPGYFELTGGGHPPIAVGQPWGRPCAPELVELEGVVSPALLAQVTAAIGDFATYTDLNIKMSARTSATSTTGTGWGAEPEGPQADIPISIARNAPTVVLGSAADRLATWKAVQADGRVTFSRFDGRLYTELTGDDPVRIRKAIRLIMARSIGIMYSDRPGSGLRRDLNDSIDGFSAEDQQALRRFSGC